MGLEIIPWIPVQLLLMALTLFCFLAFWEPKNWKILRKIPGPYKLPILGNSLDLNVQNYQLLYVLEKWMKEYGKRVFIAFGTSPRILLANAKDVEKVLGSNVHINKSEDYGHVVPWLGNGLITRGAEGWMGRRRLLTPSFHFRILDTFFQVFNEHSTTLVQDLEKKFGDGKPFDIFPHITRCALDVISELLPRRWLLRKEFELGWLEISLTRHEFDEFLETTMGTKVNSQHEESEYISSLYRESELMLYRMIRPWLHSEFMWRLTSSGREEKILLSVLHGFTEKVIRERKAELAQKKLEGKWKRVESQNENDVYAKGKTRLAFLDLLLEAQVEGIENGGTAPALTDLQIREEVDTFMFAGHDTTTANISWSIFLIASDPEVQAKVHEELDGIFADDPERPITTEDLTRMKYLEKCIKESLRVYPSVPVIGRKLHSELPLDDDVTLPSGTTVFVIPYFLHRDTNVFPDPEVFDPERFSPEAANGRHPYAYTPFSAGPRNCIGQKFAVMEVKVVLAQIFRRFTITALEKKEDIVLCVDLILRPQNGLKIKLSPRK